MSLVSKGGFLAIGGAGSIGQAVVRNIFMRNPASFDTVNIDCEPFESESLLKLGGPYDYVFDPSARKRLRSEKDP